MRNTILLTLIMTLIMLFASCNDFNNDLNDYFDSNLGVATVRQALPPASGSIVPTSGDISIVEGDSVLMLKLDNPHNFELIPRLLGSNNPARFTLSQTASDTFLLGIRDVDFGERFMLSLELYVANRPDFYSTNKLPDIVCIAALEVSVDPDDFDPDYPIVVDYPITLDVYNVAQANWFMNYKEDPVISTVTFKFQREGKEETIEETYSWDKRNNSLLGVAKNRYNPDRPLSISFPADFEPVIDKNIINNNKLIDLETVYHFMVIVKDEINVVEEAKTANFSYTPNPSDIEITVAAVGFNALNFEGVPTTSCSPGDTISLVNTGTQQFSHWFVKMSGGTYSYTNSKDSVTDTFSFSLPTEMAVGTYTVQVFAYDDPLDVYSGNFMLTVVTQ